MQGQPSSWECPHGKLAIQDDLGDATIIHPAGVAKPAQTSLSEDGKHAWHTCLGENGCVHATILPCDAQELSEAVHVESIQPLLLCGVQSQGFIAIEKGTQ